MNIETYYWATDEYHHDNNVTMCDYIDVEMPESYEIVMVDGTYAEVTIDGILYALHASGNGDSFNHKVEFERIG